jgi:hypothetical protein
MGLISTVATEASTIALNKHFHFLALRQ